MTKWRHFLRSIQIRYWSILTVNKNKRDTNVLIARFGRFVTLTISVSNNAGIWHRTPNRRRPMGVGDPRFLLFFWKTNSLIVALGYTAPWGKIYFCASINKIDQQQLHQQTFFRVHFSQRNSGDLRCTLRQNSWERPCPNSWMIHHQIIFASA